MRSRPPVTAPVTAAPDVPSSTRSPARRCAAEEELATLFRQASAGDQAAFAAVYDATSARVYGLAVRIIRSEAQAEEVAQEAFLEIWRTSQRFDPTRGTAISWILMITHAAAVDRVRSAQARTNREERYRRETSPNDPAAARRHPRPGARVPGGGPGPRRPHPAPSGPARGAGARLLRRLHLRRRGRKTRRPAWHRQVPDPRRAPPPARPSRRSMSSGTMPLASRLRQPLESPPSRISTADALDLAYAGVQCRV